MYVRHFLEVQVGPILGLSPGLYSQIHAISHTTISTVSGDINRGKEGDQGGVSVGVMGKGGMSVFSMEVG
jgi:hypothetical protein